MLSDFTEFQMWFANCAVICANDSSYPDYTWDLKNCQNWQDRFEKGISPEDAVNIEFKLN